ncbi:C-type lectin domain family 4 member M-like [Sinocyclocheilus rhinocerous]|uniref:C-type lectin domain family 4 member M-like n=1 Tax=Sinocyclocheilus rhinocerous TaxID=307959 RepID=UPI0007B84A1F|nr:PREDICTED: C-type lectin domain family 4 member M-like [Sinocyclocheilus rhinocerous]
MFTDGWIYYQFSLYYVSTETKSWTESRRYCIERGADLVIIKDSKKQDFVKKISCGSQTWIGLTDIEVEGTWKWVDGSALTSGFWNIDEPLGYTVENCIVTNLILLIV